MNSELTYRSCLWIVLILSLAGCVPATVTIAPTKEDVNAFSTQIARTVVAQITQTAFVTPTLTPPSTRTPWPTQTPLPVYTHDGQLKAFIAEGNLYFQNSNGENVQLTDSNADSTPIFSDDGKKIVFYRWSDIALYSINTDGSNEKQIVEIPSLAVQEPAKIRALTFIKNTHILIFNIYICGQRPGLYNAADCFVSTYSVDADTGKIEEIGQRVSGIGFNEGNFQISPNQKYISVAGSGHINIFSYSLGNFKLSHFGAFTYRMTRPDEFLPYQYWLPDSRGLIFVESGESSNEPGTPPQVYAVWRYNMNQNITVQLPFDPPVRRIHGTECNFSISPDRNWIFYASDKYGGSEIKVYLGNLNNGQSHEYKWEGGCGGMDTHDLKWSPDSKYFATSGFSDDIIGSVDGLLSIHVNGFFSKWIDATHYYYQTIENNDIHTLKTYAAEIGGESILVPTSTPNK